MLQVDGAGSVQSRAMFAKGEEVEKLVIVIVVENAYKSMCRMGGLLAMLTAASRVTPITPFSTC